MIKIFFPYIYLTQCWFIVLWKMLGIFFLYFPVHPRFTISELIESDNKTNGKTSQKPLQSHCIFYNKYRKLGLSWRFYHVPTRNYIPIYIQNDNLFLKYIPGAFDFRAFGIAHVTCMSSVSKCMQFWIL